MSATQGEAVSHALDRGVLELIGLSDDLTGATALASELHGAGWRAQVATSPTRPAAGVDALVVDTGTRCAAEAAAADRVARALGSLGAPAAGWYKRVDSGLRGNVRAELAAVAAALGRPLVLAPAAPSLGIVTLGGVQRLGDIPVDDTRFGDGPDGARTAALEDLVPEPAGLGIDQVRGAELARALAELVAAGRHVVCDAETDEDLARVGAVLAAPALRGRVVPVGSYGLARPWAAGLRPAPAAGRRPVLAAVSSLKPVSLRQAAVAAARGAHVTWNAAEADLSAAGRALDRGRDAVLVSAPRGAVPAAPTAAVATALAGRVEALARGREIAGLVLVGGDLASAFLEASRATAEVLATPWPATAVMALAGGPLDGRPAIFKSGSQGTEEWLDQAAGLIRCLREATHAG